MFGRTPLTASLSSERSTGMESSLRMDLGEGSPPIPHLRRPAAETAGDDDDDGRVEKQRTARIQDMTKLSRKLDIKHFLVDSGFAEDRIRGKNDAHEHCWTLPWQTSPTRQSTRVS